jgi:hypothetical protein
VIAQKDRDDRGGDQDENDRTFKLTDEKEERGAAALLLESVFAELNEAFRGFAGR